MHTKSKALLNAFKNCFLRFPVFGGEQIPRHTNQLQNDACVYYVGNRVNRLLLEFCYQLNILRFVYMTFSFLSWKSGMLYKHAEGNSCSVLKILQSYFRRNR